MSEQTIKVAVYGTLREGQGNWAWALNHPGAKKLGDCVIGGFKMYSTGGFPACVQGEGHRDIQAEVFEVDEKTFKRLDGLEGYPHMYDRVEVPTPFGDAWVYVWQGSTAPLQLIPDGDWVKFRAGRIRA